VADGLAACSAEQVGLGARAPAACPDAAKLGSVEAEAPALGQTLRGSIYLRAPEPGAPFALWITTDTAGVFLKLPAQVEADPLSGRLRVAIGAPDSAALPQLPLGSVALHLFAGPRAALITPARCGTYDSDYALAPWSGRPAARGSLQLEVAGGCEQLPYAPRIEAGTLDPRAGRASAAVFTLTRRDGEPDLGSIDARLPAGLLARLQSTTSCPVPTIAADRCPETSRVGHAVLALGAGAAPLWIPQPGRSPTAIHLAGPYKGAPYSLAIVLPAQAGPFDFGTLTIRAALEIDIAAARARIIADPLPQIAFGVPLPYRALHLAFDRPGFIVNPTDCDPLSIEATLTAVSGALASLATGFQATNCARLGLRPRFRLRLGPGLARNAHPQISLDLAPRPGDAALATATATFPAGELLDLRHIRALCPSELPPERCPSRSRIGNARLSTPLLAEPFRGPIYLRRPAHRLPGLTADLRHGPLRFALEGFTATSAGHLRATFPDLPDLPVSHLRLTLAGGRRGIFVNSQNLCSTAPSAALALTAHNGRHRRIQTRARLSGDC
jgi:hypothetical protein